MHRTGMAVGLALGRHHVEYLRAVGIDLVDGRPEVVSPQQSRFSRIGTRFHSPRQPHVACSTVVQGNVMHCPDGSQHTTGGRYSDAMSERIVRSRPTRRSACRTARSCLTAQALTPLLDTSSAKLSAANSPIQRSSIIRKESGRASSATADPKENSCVRIHPWPGCE